MERPSSAPGYHPPVEEGESNADTNVDDATATLAVAEIKEMEMRASEALGKENRGHKLPLEELPVKRPKILQSRARALSPPMEIEFEEVERSFSEYQHYLHDSNTEGLLHSQVHLLHSYWSQFASSKAKLAAALQVPEKLSEAGESIAVRHDLAGASLAVLSDALMKLIEEEHGRLVPVLQLIEMLNLRLVQLEDGLLSVPEDGEEVAAVELKQTLLADQLTPASVAEAGEKETLMQVLALANDNAKSSQRFLRKISIARSLIVMATQYGHLLGRFLIKRHRKVQELNRHVSDSSSISVRI